MDDTEGLVGMSLDASIKMRQYETDDFKAICHLLERQEEGANAAIAELGTAASRMLQALVESGGTLIQSFNDIIGKVVEGPGKLLAAHASSVEAFTKSGSCSEKVLEHLMNSEVRLLETYQKTLADVSKYCETNVAQLMAERKSVLGHYVDVSNRCMKIVESILERKGTLTRAILRSKGIACPGEGEGK